MFGVYNTINGRFLICLYLCFTILLFTWSPLFAEGSKELNANGGSRAFLVSGTSVTPSFLFPTPGTMKVYAKVGETINLGSSVQGMGAGTINLRAPNGNTYTSSTSTTIGRIVNRAQEAAGPLPNIGGYTPYTHTVQAGEDGVWEIDFISQNNGVPGGENPVPVPASANWTQPTGQYITAFDVSVRNAANTAFLTGRVYTNIFSGILGTFDVGFNGIFNILTKDGYQYSLDNNGQAGNGFSFFVNNKGFRQADGTASYLSVNSLNNTNIQDPRAADTPSDITYKIFFNSPAADLPATANTPGGGTTWLLNPVSPSTLANVNFTGFEGTANKAGTAPLGSSFGFTANKNGTYTITVDVNKNGVFTDPVDRVLSGIVVAGPNLVNWDGLDGLNNKTPAGNYTANLNITLFGGEVHFPFFDVERNVNGIKLTRSNGFLAPDFTVYWDDSPITITGTPSNPVKNITGLNSQINGHKWGTAGNTATEFGDEKGLDTWAYIAATPVVATLNFQLQEADLEVTAINASTTGGCVGQIITYTIPVKNNGPNAVTGSKFSFSFPADLTGVTVNSIQTTGVSAISNGTIGAGIYTANVDLTNGAVRTFTVTGKVATVPANGNVTVTASILRTVDMTDPDATNPDTAPPTDAQAECDAPPSGTGCNNIKTNSTAFIALPDAGPDQNAVQNDMVTLTANGPGTWSQLGNVPATAIIATPAALTTTISGLKDVGLYTFLRTNTLGCVDTVTVNVVPKKLDVPTIITPNGDGKNDTFTIPNLGSFPGSRLLIFNRWGNEVYRSENYKNTWSGEGLTEGTYYYVLNKKELSGSYTTFKGWIFLKR